MEAKMIPGRIDTIIFGAWLANLKRGEGLSTGEKLKRFGLTGDEIVAWKAVADAANRCLGLPFLHGMERHELCHYFHLIQDSILARAGLRALEHEIGKGSG
jgi:hypothetical protein